MAQDVTQRDPHDVLGVRPGSSGTDIKQAFRMLALEVHPDVNPAPEAGERFQEIKAAHDALMAQEGTEARTRKPRRKRAPRGMGSVFLRGPIYWVAFTHGGKRHADSAKSTVKEHATDLLKACHAAIHAGTFTTIAHVRDFTRPTSGVCLGDMRDAVLAACEDSRRRLGTVKRVRGLFANLTRLLGEDAPAETINEDRIKWYVATRRKEHVGSARDEKGNLKNPKTISNATINRELVQLRRGFRLLRKRVGSPPDIFLLGESGPRERYPEAGEVERVIAKLPEHLQAPMTLLRLTGWRVREALRLEWRRVDTEVGTIRLEGRDTKTRKPRSYQYSAFPELAALMAARRAATDAWQKEHGQVVRHVFWRASTDERGRPVAAPITLWSTAWNRACRKAKVTDLIPHDMRRGAARDLIRAGVDEAVAQKLLGHATASIFRRYNITADDDLRTGVQRLAQAAQRRATDEKRQQA